MKTVMKFKADDGAEFVSEIECVEYEKLCAEIAGVMGVLPPKPDSPGCRFENGGGYIQHDPATVTAVRASLLRIAQRLNPHDWFVNSIEDKTIHSSWAGRLISEMSAPLYRAWHRISCTDSQFREWGQPYYEAHPNEAKQVRLN